MRLWGHHDSYGAVAGVAMVSCPHQRCVRFVRVRCVRLRSERLRIVCLRFVRCARSRRHRISSSSNVI